MILPLFLLIVGFALLVKGADWLVDGASDIARRFGISDLFIGLTIVAFGTSMPELVVNIIASVQGNTAIAIGNIVGSNISNTLLILGVTAILAPIAVQSSTVRKEIPFSLLAACALFFVANDALIDGYDMSEISRGDGLIFMSFFLIFLYYTFGIAKKSEPIAEAQEHRLRSGWIALLCLVAGGAMLVLGGKLAVDAAVSIARALGISDSLIGLTIVAIGTSLPELASSAAAAYKGKPDIAVGNVVGSNIFNVFWILGLSAVIKPLPFDRMMNVDLGFVILSTVLLLLTVHTGHLHRRVLFWWRQRDAFLIRKWEGALLLLTYVSYMAYIVARG